MLSRSARREKLKQLKEARRTGRNINVIESDGDDYNEIYDEVDEETYRQHKRNQLMNDDFIVDDNGEGYVDTGADEWDDASRPNYYSDEEVSDKKRRKKDEKAVKVPKTSQIRNFFKPVSGVSETKKKLETNIDDILDDFNDVAPKKRNIPKAFATSNNNNRDPANNKKKAKNAFNFSTSTSKFDKRNTKVETFNESSDYTMDFDTIDDQPSSPVKLKSEPTPDTEPEIEKENIDPKPNKLFPDDEPLKEQPQPKPQTEEHVDGDDDDSDEDIIISRRPRAAAVKKNNLTTVSSVKASELPPPVTSKPLYSKFANHTDKVDEGTIRDSSESFKMFWLDYSETDTGLLLFGKIMTKEGKLVSGVVRVNGLCRELYILPREHPLVDGEEDQSETVTPADVLDEINPILLSNYKLDSIRAKPERKKYAFELADIPKEAEYLKVLLPFSVETNKHIMPSNIEGSTFRHIFGTNTNIFEAFVTQRNVMGPCWLEIRGGDFDAMQNVSHCQAEVVVDSPNDVIPIDKNAPPPPNLTVTAISVQTVMNAKTNKQEVVSVSLATYFNLPQDAPISESIKPNDVLTLARPVGAVSFPPGLQQLADKEGFQLRTCPNEKVLLNALAAKIKSLDPDVYVGHRLENISLDVLVHRMNENKVMTWSALGRRSRKQWPYMINKNNSSYNNSLLVRDVFQGRLLCDIANEMGQSLTMKCQSWDLHEMYDVVCHKRHGPVEINYQNIKYAEDAFFFLMALKENEFNVMQTAEIAFGIQILSLSKQLTNIAGNAWSHTLSGTRAGRNEYILLHEFKRNNYIVPDKEDKTHKNTSYQQEARVENAEEDATTATSNKKPKYQGGLVFEPEKGLHKNYVLVMDFNSLYPSIIQEFNICFTTVERDRFNTTHDENKDMPTLPERESEPGVLPRLLNTLVSRRREVKKLLKDPKNTAFQKAQYDIKQQALKLTANSMYGCLGYVNSRFYAKPLAMLVTNKGREILMDTRQLAESSSLRVVYGDTDSVMIDTGASSFKEAIKIGGEFKVQVNERYRLLEIDIDNVFKRLLLHAKKKYAAMNASVDRATGEESATLEVKGLDMRRREYCQLSKDISTFVLMKILSDLDPETALIDIYNYLEEMKNKIQNNEIPVDRYKINTKLSKDPKSYPNGKSMPQVQVALKLREQGKVIKAGSVITYAITASQNEEDKSGPAERARSIQELLSKKNPDLKPDPTYYLEKQIFAPVERLLERIEGVDMVRVAGSLGIDTKRYILRVKNSESANGEILPMESSIPDSERFRTSSYLVLNCKCGHSFRFGGILASPDYKVTFHGVCCQKCEYTFPAIRLTSQLESMIRKHIALYYAGWLVCDDPACGITTRQISVYGRRCIGASGRAMDCKGVMRYRYTDKQLYNQLLYFNSIFDVDKTKRGNLRPIRDALEEKDGDKSIPKLPSGQVDALAEQNRELFAGCQDVVQKYLTECGRRYVNMGSIFDFMNV
ncbi:DNA polymerase alpha catalytic subunit A [Candida viswanathii]|uniref:DNA polymerase n=1 Tax=Candida viswanathii TaxID=5486 RepID=A0A367XY23_9ASCO|nr:DNA polymerase alpha catalytic subunit A [Candida viswanathii]